jgi:hypothetical protein
MPAALPFIGAALIAAGPLTTLGYVIAYSLILSSYAFADRARRIGAKLVDDGDDIIKAADDARRFPR